MKKNILIFALTISVISWAQSPFGQRDVYYKIKSISELHNNDTIVFVNETANRVSAEFETYTYKKKNDKGVLVEYTAGRLKPAETEIIRVKDSIGCWGAYEVHLKNTTKGWQIYVTDWVYNKITTEYDKTEALVVASEKGKIMVKGDGNAFWDISFNNGNAIIKSKDSKAGSLQFNNNNKTFTTYTSTQQPIQIYRLAKQTVDSSEKDDPVTPANLEPVKGYKQQATGHKLLRNGQIIIVHNEHQYTILGEDATDR